MTNQRKSDKIENRDGINKVAYEYYTKKTTFDYRITKGNTRKFNSILNAYKIFMFCLYRINMQIFRKNFSRPGKNPQKLAYFKDFNSVIEILPERGAFMPIQTDS